ncbi:hypothetical protein TRIP_B50615 [uncultured Desulfatiglans sp.]|uniref:Uncharacterized protein n=1 Tax=Uncultured Desulfatiglans sp. TaxID=1748965 RepID=A0A653AIC6_UNCDX|nr:hypothetical protein TRIP_B50615 [uncultured Desulfatiglans sp.]
MRIDHRFVRFEPPPSVEFETEREVGVDLPHQPIRITGVQLGPGQDRRQLDQRIVVADDARPQCERQRSVHILLFLFRKTDDEAERRDDALLRRFHDTLIEDAVVDPLADEGQGLFGARVDPVAHAFAARLAHEGQEIPVDAVQTRDAVPRDALQAPFQNQPAESFHKGAGRRELIIGQKETLRPIKAMDLLHLPHQAFDGVSPHTSAPHARLGTIHATMRAAPSRLEDGDAARQVTGPPVHLERREKAVVRIRQRIEVCDQIPVRIPHNAATVAPGHAFDSFPPPSGCILRDQIAKGPFAFATDHRIHLGKPLQRPFVGEGRIVPAKDDLEIPAASFEPPADLKHRRVGGALGREPYEIRRFGQDALCTVIVDVRPQSQAACPNLENEIETNHLVGRFFQGGRQIDQPQRGKIVHGLQIERGKDQTDPHRLLIPVEIVGLGKKNRREKHSVFILLQVAACVNRANQALASTLPQEGGKGPLLRTLAKPAPNDLGSFPSGNGLLGQSRRQSARLLVRRPRGRLRTNG